MNWPQHILIGALFGVVAALFLQLPLLESVLVVGMAALSSLAPDIDHDSSKIRRLSDVAVPIAALGFSFASTCSDGSACTADDLRHVVILGLAITGLYMVVITFFKPSHRGITHTLFSAIIFAMFIYVFSDMNFAIAGFLGYASHLAADKHLRLI